MFAGGGYRSRLLQQFRYWTVENVCKYVEKLIPLKYGLDSPDALAKLHKSRRIKCY